MNKQSIIILSIDPGYDRCGWAIGIGNKGEYENLDFGLIQTKKSEPIFERFTQISVFLSKLIEQYQPQHLAIENLYFAKNTSTAMRVAEIRGLIFGLAIKSEIEIFEYDPNTIKACLTGNGQADKTSMIKMVKLLLKKTIQIDKPIPDDAYDALGVGVTHARSYKMKSLLR